MSGNWDDEDYEVPIVKGAPTTAAAVNDRWAGEDEEKVKENWDDEEDDIARAKKAASYTTTIAPPKKSRKQLIAESQAKKEAELIAKRQEMDRLNAAMTAEEKLTEKIRLQKVQEESDLQFAVDMMGIKECDSIPVVSSLDDADLSSEPGLEALSTAVIKKIRDTEKLEMKNYYVPFVENICKELCLNLDVDEIKKVTASLNALYNEKVKANKPIKGKKKGSKAKLHLGKEADTMNDDRYINDFDDFI